MNTKEFPPEICAGCGLQQGVISQLHELLHRGADAARGQGQGEWAQLALTPHIHQPTVQVRGSVHLQVVS